MMLHPYLLLYRDLGQAFQRLQSKAMRETTTGADLKSDWLEIQQMQQQIMAFQLEPLDEEAKAENAKVREPSDFESQFQPIQTEITKQLRLLETDLLFLQAARQPTTAQQHKQRITERLTLLQHYCETILTFQNPTLSDDSN